MSEQSVLIIDDEPDIRELLEITLSRMGLETYSAGNVQEGLVCLKENKPDLCLTDMKLPDGTGIDIVNYIQHHMPEVPVAVITAFGSMETAVDALKSGAYDFVSKPVDLQKLRGLIETALQVSKKNESNKKSHSYEQVSNEVNQERALDDSAANELILGKSPAIKKLLKTISKLGKSQANIYIHGESGSGKELVAKSIHNCGPQQGAPFVPVNCGAIPENLVESEFFGHKKGSFSGATADKQGLFQAADGGTLFLDEVADLPLEMQVKLLRAIQEKAVKPVGGTEEISVNVRILSASHKELDAEVTEKRFRDDLYYRLNVITLEVPPLRDRGYDILLLAEHFSHKIALSWGLDKVVLTDEAQDALLKYSFQGNVRELVNILERSCTLSDDGTITVEDLQLPPSRGGSQFSQTSNTGNLILPEWEKGSVSNREEKRMIEMALEKAFWNRTKAAVALGMTLRQLRYRIKKYNLEDKMLDAV